MSIPGSLTPLFSTGSSAAAGYQIERSLRFNSADSAYLSRTPAVAGNRRTWTWAGWVKRSALGTEQNIFTCMEVSNAFNTNLMINTDNAIYVYDSISNPSTGIAVQTTQVFRDVSAWFHVVLAYNTTQATASDKLKLYINGTEVTQFSTDNRSGLTSDSSINRAAQHSIGSRLPYPVGSHFSGYLADIHFIDGQALDATAFTEVSATTGQLLPKAYSGSFGTNGFWLKFSDNSAATAATLGKDYSGNSNNWTPNNLSVTAGAGNDSLVDTPTSISATDTGVGGEIRGNYCTWNPLINTGLTISNGNLEVSGGGSPTKEAHGTLAMSNAGKWYFEITTTGSSLQFMGIGGSELNSSGGSLSSYGYNEQGRLFINAADQGIQFSTYGSGDIIGFAVDLDANTIRFYKNGVAQGSGTTSIAANKNYSPLVNLFSGGGILNAGQRAFAYTAPSGFKALCDTNLGAPLVAKPSTVFDVITYTGTGSSLTLPNGSSTPTSISFTPDFAWLKGRSGATNHALYDAVRGVQKDLVSNSTSAETTETTGLTAFGTNTFTVGSLAKLNTSSSTYVAWAWDAGSTPVAKVYGAAATVSSTAPLATTFISNASPSTVPNSYQNYDLDLGRSVTTIDIKFTYTANTISYLVSSDGTNWTSLSTGNSQTAGATVTISHTSAFRYLRFHYPPGNFNQGFQEINNTQGSITSQVRANVSAGFSVVTFTMVSSGSATVGHGLGVAPSLIIAKARTGGASNWGVFHSAVCTKDNFLYLNTTGALGSYTDIWGTAVPTSTVFGVNFNLIPASQDIVAYCFSPVVGYSSFGSYTGNGSTDGPFVFLGFRPKWVMWKRTDTAQNWNIIDSQRDTYNVTANYLLPNSSNAETNEPPLLDFVSNGFKIRAPGAYTGINPNGGTFIYACFAENPLQYARAR